MAVKLKILSVMLLLLAGCRAKVPPIDIVPADSWQPAQNAVANQDVPAAIKAIEVQLAAVAAAQQRLAAQPQQPNQNQGATQQQAALTSAIATLTGLVARIEASPDANTYQAEITKLKEEIKQLKQAQSPTQTTDDDSDTTDNTNDDDKTDNKADDKTPEPPQLTAGSYLYIDASEGATVVEIKDGDGDSMSYSVYLAIQQEDQRVYARVNMSGYGDEATFDTDTVFLRMCASEESSNNCENKGQIETRDVLSIAAYTTELTFANAKKVKAIKIHPPESTEEQETTQ
ncbi:MAG: hypothetical protein OYH77_06995 [Pseudomonadota bacterium]|nr:hypothetical protein [Pseudomonadota bacterium]